MKRNFLEELIEKNLVKVCSMLTHRKLPANTIKSTVQFLEFALLGFTNSIIYILVNICVLFFLADFNVRFDYVFANLAAFLLSVLWAFYWNYNYIFKIADGERRSLTGSLLKMYATYGFTGLILNNFLSWIWIDMLCYPKYIAPVLNILIGLPFDFIVSKFWTFRN